MKPLTINLGKGVQRSLQSLGWKTPPEGEFRKSFYALHGDSCLVVTLHLALPQFYIPGYPVCFSDPFPEFVCIEITPCRLLPPPCFATKQQFDEQTEAFTAIEPWIHIYSHTHEQVMILEPKDDEPLKKKLKDWLSAMNANYKRARTRITNEIKINKTASLEELGLATESDRADKLATLRAQLGWIESENPIAGLPNKGHLNLCLDDVKQGAAGIRDRYLHEQWALQQGLELREIARERCNFRQWLETHTGTPARILNTGKQDISRPSFGDNPDSAPPFLDACSRVRYRARFSDAGKTVVYLSGCELRDEPTAAEIDEMEKLMIPVRAAKNGNFKPSSRARTKPLA